MFSGFKSSFGFLKLCNFFFGKYHLFFGVSSYGKAFSEHEKIPLGIFRHSDVCKLEKNPLFETKAAVDFRRSHLIDSIQIFVIHFTKTSQY